MTKIEREEVDKWLSDNCGKGIPHGEATDIASMLHGLAYILRQIEGTSSYKVNIGQTISARTALRFALDHFAKEALRAHNSDSAEPVAWICAADLDWMRREDGCDLSISPRIREDLGMKLPLYLASPPAKEVDLFELVRVAYFRGYQWCVENPDSPEYVAKAAYDYADKTTSALTNRTPDDEVGNG